MIASLLLGVQAVGVAAPTASAQTCVTNPATTYGQVTQSVSVATAGTYRVWSRIKAPNTANNSYYFQVNGGCVVNVGDYPIPASTWTWVNYKDGSTSSYIDVNLTAGTHQLKYTGKEADVQLDRILLLADTGCVPTGTGDNCATADTILPTVSLTAPANGSSAAVGTTVTISANASDNIGVSKVEFYNGTTLLNTGGDTSSPYSYAWNTTGQTAGTKNLTAKAYDAAGNVATSTAVAITLTTTTTDTTLPTVSLTAPANGSSASVGSTVTISANASDNIGVTKVEFYNGATLLTTDTGSPYSYGWNTAGVAAGTKTLTAKAYDAAGNVATSTAVSINLTAVSGNGDANGDGRVNAIDLSIVISKDGQNYPAADFNRDGVVGAADLSILLSKWTW